MRPTDAQYAILLTHAAEMARESSHEVWRDRFASGGSPELSFTLDAVLAAENAWEGLELAVDRDLVPFGLDPLTLPAVERLISTSPPTDVDRLLAALTSSKGKRRALLAAFLLHQVPLAFVSELSAALSSDADERELELLLGLTLPSERRALLASIESARARRAATTESHLAQITAATMWRDAWGLPAEPFRIRVQCQDVSRTHRRASHLREQTSHLGIEIAHTPTRTPELDVAWAVRLHAGSGEPKHSFIAARWSGEIRATMVDLEEVVGAFREARDSPIRKGRVVELRGTLDSLPRLVGEIEALTERSFHVSEATIIASVGDALDRALAERVRSWLVER